MLRRVFVLALALALAACGDDEPDVLDPQDLRIVIVRGDGQVSEVAPAGPSADVVMSVRYDKTPDPSTVLPDTLVARITGPEASASLTGPSFAVLPPNTVAYFAVTENGCGSAWIPSAIPDSDGYVRTLWELPTKLPGVRWYAEGWGRMCEMEVRVLVDADFVTDTIFRAFFTPGPVRYHSFFAGNVFAGKEIGHAQMSDAHQNLVPYEYRVDCDCAEAIGTIEQYGSVYPKVVPIAPGEGLLHVVALGGDTIATAQLTVRQSTDGDWLEILAQF